jgi:hypothetical protein
MKREYQSVINHRLPTMAGEGKEVFHELLKSFTGEKIFCAGIIWLFAVIKWGPSWSWSYGSWIYNYLCNQCPSPLMLWVRNLIRGRCITLCDKVCQWLATGLWFSPGPPVSSTNKTERHNITEILLKVTLNIIKQKTNKRY